MELELRKTHWRKSKQKKTHLSITPSIYRRSSRSLSCSRMRPSSMVHLISLQLTYTAGVDSHQNLILLAVWIKTYKTYQFIQHNHNFFLIYSSPYVSHSLLPCNPPLKYRTLLCHKGWPARVGLKMIRKPRWALATQDTRAILLDRGGHYGIASS